MKFLLVEDDLALAEAIEQLLASHHYVMDLATDGLMGQNMAEVFPYDLIMLDWTLPKLDGMQLCQYLRNQGNYTPIILLTARNDSTDKIAGLDAGADDYLVKPFEFEELLARIRALLRRAEGIVSPILQWGDLCLDPRNSEVTCRSVPIAVTPKEYALLELFLRNPSRIFSLDNLLDKVWPFEDSPHVGSVRTHIKGLRQKLKKAGVPDIISTVYGLGYRLKSADAVGSRDAQTDQLAESAAKIDHEAIAAPQAAAIAESPSTKNAGTESQIKSDLSSLWQGVRDRYIQRMANLANVVRRLQPGSIDNAEQQQILTEAHSLAGSLGSFGFGEITQQCREVEHILHSNAYLSAQHIQRLEALMVQAQQTLELEVAAPESQLNAVSGLSLKSATFSAELPPGKLFHLMMVEARCDRDQNWLQTLKDTAAAYQIQVNTVESIAQARQIILSTDSNNDPQSLPNVIVFDFDGTRDLPDNNSAEFELLTELQSKQPSIATIVLTATASFENRVRVARLGVTGLLQTPVTPAELLETAKQVLQKGVPPAAKLPIVDDDPAMLILLQNLLEPWGFRLQTLSNPKQFWQVLERFEPDLVLLDVKMPEISGFDLAQVLRNAPRWHNIPVIFMSGYTDADTIQKVFSVGADDYIRKPIVAPELVVRVLGWLERARTRRLSADVDSLTKVDNRQKSTQLLTQMLGLSQQQGQTLCLALIDFDHFKQINDEYGHLLGDRILKRFGESLRATFRPEDVVGRWGGEEFVVGLYGLSRQEGVQRLHHFLQSWQQEQFTCDGNLSEELASESTDTHQKITVTFTAGVAVYPHDGTNLQALYRAADKALNEAKSAGRNRINPVSQETNNS